MKKESKAEGIVAGGAERIRSSDGFRKKMEEIRKRVEEEYAREYAAASWLGKFRVRAKIEKEIRLEGERLAPQRALYLAGRG